MKTLIFCVYNMDNCCVELKFADGSMIAIDTIAVENEVLHINLSISIFQFASATVLNRIDPSNHIFAPLHTSMLFARAHIHPDFVLQLLSGASYKALCP